MKFDYYAQWLLVIGFLAAGVISVFPGHGGYSILAIFGTLPLTLWQLISAGINTYRFKENSFKLKHIKRYWTAVAASIVSISLSLAIQGRAAEKHPLYLPLLVVGLVGLGFCIFYYLYILKSVLMKQQLDDSSFSIVS